MIGLFLLIFGLAALGGSSSIFPLILGVIGFFLLARQFDKAKTGFDEPPQQRPIERPIEEAEERLTRQTSGADQVYRHAIDAVRRAGRDPGETQVLPVDIGVIALRDGVAPVVHRSQPVDDDVDYIQPFVQLRIPRRAMGRIRFEIIDSDEQVLFIHEDVHELERGRNLVTPGARLPIHDAHIMQGNWQLRVSADGLPLATHVFKWREGSEKAIRRHIREDGEITNELKAAIMDNTPGSMSLDDLLGYTPDDAQQQASGRR
jgi:hypothetical protein